MKKRLLIIIEIISFLFCSAWGLTACGTADKPEKIKIVATIFPEYDWVKNVIGEDSDDVEVTLLLDSGADLHSYQPTFKDVMTISECDLFIYVGGESDSWAADGLKKAKNKNMRVVDCITVLGDSAEEEEIVEGMQDEEEEEEHGEEGEVEYDEHVWLSLKNAMAIVDEIERNLSEVSPENSEKYAANAAEYKSKLKVLDEKYAAAVKAGAKDTLLFADRFPFRYLTDDYGLKYYAAFVGCSAETEASPQTIKGLALKVDELSLGTILKIESSDGKIAETVKNTTVSKNQQILVMDSLQSSTLKEYNAGRTYLNVMEKNLETLIEALK